MISVVLRWSFRIAFATLLAIGLGYAPYRVFGPEGAGRALRLKRKLTHILGHNQQLARQNAELLDEIDRLNRDSKEVERVARDELGMVRSEDLVFHFE